MTESMGEPVGSDRGPGRRGRLALTGVAVLALAACGGDVPASDDDAEPAASLTLYTRLSDESIQPVIEAFEAREDGGTVELFRAPTGELDARVAADARSGGQRADVIWGCDPLTVQAFVDQGLVGGWTPPGAEAIPEELRTEDYVGAHVLYMVAVHRTEVPAPRAWSDLMGGDYDAGITTANSAYAAKDDGSPVDVVWPEPGAVAIYGPVALATHSADSDVAKSFVAFVVSEEGQSVLGASGAYPTLPGVEGPAVPDGAPVVSPDWAAIGADEDAILGEYQQLFGG